MGRNARLSVVVLLAVMGVAAYAGLTNDTADSLDVDAAAESIAQPTPPAILADVPPDAMGLPADPLPDPILVDADDPDSVASTLAQTVVAGGGDALPALVTALSRSGFAIYGPDDMVAVRPTGADEGFFFESWQVRSMAGGIGSRKHVSVPFTWLGAAVASAIPVLKDEPIAQLLTAGIAESAGSDDPSLRFWARFIIELGKQTHSYGSYDLLTSPDVNTVRLDVIQLALITKRLAADVAKAIGPAAAVHTPRSLFSIPVVHADEPCIPMGPRPSPTASRTAFGQFIRTVTAPGRAMDRAFGPGIANNMDYAMLMLMLSALKVDVELENGPPLRRTKTTSPGEPRKIRATVSLDGVPLEWMNCYRAWVNSRGRELRSFPRSNGPVPSVAVEFNLDGRALVRIPTSAPAAERGLPGATTTDTQGVARLALEGEPQERALREPAREQRKTAAVTVSAKVKMSDLLTRSHPTEGIASTDFVHEWVTEQDFTIDVPYTFEVIDWSDTPGRWTGTITIVETAISESSGVGAFDRGGHTTQDTETKQLTVRVTDTTDEQAMSGLHATLKGRLEGRYTQLKTFAGWTMGSCGQITNRRMNNTSRESSAGSGDAEAVISVNVFEDGTYLIAASAESFTMPITGQFAGELEVFRSGGQGCVVATKADSRQHSPSEQTAGGLIQVNGRVDPKTPDTLSGSTSEESGPGSATQGTRYKRVKTTTWNFQRQ
jgi:hypothetical protein